MTTELMSSLLAGVLRYLWTSGQAPYLSPEDRLRDAILFAGGHRLGTELARRQIQGGRSPVAAFTRVGVPSLLAMSAAAGHPLQPLAAGCSWGAASGAIAGEFDPNWALQLRPRLYISHAFRDTDELIELHEALAESGLSWSDHSVPVFDQFPTRSQRALQDRLRRQIRGTSAVIYLAGPGVERRPMPRFEVLTAMAYGKQVLVVDQDPLGRSRLPAFVRDYPLMRRVTLDEPRSISRALMASLSERG